MDVTVKLKGVNELQEKLKKNMDLTAVKKAVKLNGSEMNKQAKVNAPVDTGTLKRSIGLKIKNKGLSAEVEATAEYAAYVEWGTRYQAPQLYISDAFEKQKPKFKNDLKKLMK